MKNKKSFIALILILAVTSIGSYRYLQLNQESYWILEDEKDTLIHSLDSIQRYAAEIDYKKITSGDKDSIYSLIEMDKEFSVLFNITNTTNINSKFIIIEPYIMQKNMIDMNDILAKYIRGGLKSEDISKINLVAEDAEVMYKYVSENDKFGSRKCAAELEPKLKNLQVKSK